MSITKTIVARVAAAVLALAVLSCNEINRQSSPVMLVVTHSNALLQVDLLGGSTGCNVPLATVSIQPVLIQANATNTTFDDVKIDRYTVSYVRTDGGKLIPQSFTRSLDSLLSLGTTSQLNNFSAFEPNALNQAPFVALQPQNGGRDPETGLKHVSMEVVITVFGQTLAGERVTGSTRIPLDFCYDCGGCF